MNSFIRNSLVGTLMSAGLLAGAQASSVMDTGALIAGPTSITFDLLSTSSSSFSVYLTTPGGQFAPTSLSLYLGAAVTPLTPKTSNFLPSGATLTFKNLAAAEYTLEFFAPISGGSYTISTSLAPASYTVLSSSTPVPEAGTLSLALAGLGVVGFVGMRRRQA